MPKKDFAQELKEQFKRGNLKPSQLKRSKSTESLTIPQPAIPLTKSKSAEEISLSPNLAEQVKQLKQDLVFSQNTAQNYLHRLQKLEPELDHKNEEIKKLTQSHNSLTDKNNELRLQALKDADKIKEHDKELEQAANQLATSDQQRINLQVQNSQLLRTKTDLEQQLKSAESRIQKLYQLKGLPSHSPAPLTLPWKTIALTSLLGLGITILLRP